MNPLAFVADRLLRVQFRHKVLGPLEVRDRSDMERFLDVSRWLHCGDDGVLVERRWDSLHEIVIERAEFSKFLQMMCRWKSTTLILDATTIGDRSLRDDLAKTDLRVLVCREHPTEIEGFARSWIGGPWVDGEPRPKWFR